MGIFDIEYNFDNLLRATNSGLEISSFVQMKEAITKRYKEIYGNDIDVDSTTADGQFIMMVSLMLFNGYSGLYYLSQNLDPASAQGAYLDRLCSFNNVFRKTASPSYVDMYVQYIGTASDYVSNVGDTDVQEITCIDGDGNLWRWEEGKETDGFNHQFRQYKEGTTVPEIYTLRFTCQENGPIKALMNSDLKESNDPISLITGENSDNYHGDVSKTLDLTIYPFKVWQAKDAVVGNDDETDVALRERRLMEIGNNGITVINGLAGSLLNVQGVKEVKVYSNNLHEKSSDNSFIANDGSKVQFHDIYICIKYEENVSVDDAEIGKVIYNKLTPGVVTAPLNKYYNTNTSKHNYEIITESADQIFGVSKEYKVKVYLNILEYKLYWKMCKPIYPSLKLTFLINNQVAYYSEMQKVITNSFLDYTSSLTISDDFTIPNLLAYLNSCAPIVSNQKSYIFTEGVISAKIKTTWPDTSYVKYDFSSARITNQTSTTTRFENCDTYFKYITTDLHYDDTQPSSGDLYTEHTLEIYR